ncbi:5357_t:CDS:2, partial [Dentiscutata erythropus]
KLSLVEDSQIVNSKSSLEQSQFLLTRGTFYQNKHGKTESHHISIPPDSLNNTYTPIRDILLYLSKLHDLLFLQYLLFYKTFKSQKVASTKVIE